MLTMHLVLIVIIWSLPFGEGRAKRTRRDARDDSTNASMLRHISATKLRELINVFGQMSVTPNVEMNASSPNVTNSSSSVSSYCFAYNQTALRNRTVTTVYNVLAHNVTDAANDVTLLTHLTLGRFSALQGLSSRWSGPLSVALLVLDFEHNLFWKVMKSSTYHPNLRLHVVIDREGYYPVNYLRNTALTGAVTNFILLVDVDFIPMANMSIYLKKLASSKVFNKRKKKLYVVPAFEWRKPLQRPSELPETKEQLIELWYGRQGMIRPFHQHLKEAHGATNYSRWKNATEIYQVASYTDRFEPYVIVPRCRCPPYYEGLIGRNHNKVSHIMALHNMGFTFHVLPGGFLIHWPHQRQDTTRENTRCSLNAFAKFKQYLKSRKFTDQKWLPNC